MKQNYLFLLTLIWAALTRLYFLLGKTKTTMLMVIEDAAALNKIKYNYGLPFTTLATTFPNMDETIGDFWSHCDVPKKILS